MENKTWIFSPVCQHEIQNNKSLKETPYTFHTIRIWCSFNPWRVNSFHAEINLVKTVGLGAISHGLRSHTLPHIYGAPWRRRGDWTYRHRTKGKQGFKICMSSAQVFSWRNRENINGCSFGLGFTIKPFLVLIYCTLHFYILTFFISFISFF